MKDILVAISIMFVLVMVGCATLAEQLEAHVPDLVEPEIHQVDLNLSSGEAITCDVISVHIVWPDTSETKWIWSTKDSDPRCDAALEQLAED